MHLFGHLREQTGDSQVGHCGGDILCIAARSRAGVRIPGFQLTHATVHPEHNQ
jgi:hypothetical protein